MATARELIKDALIDIGSYAPDEDLESDDANTGLTALNRMLGAWSNNRLMAAYAKVTENFTLVVGTASYTIGSGATWDTPRPQRIEGAYIRDANGYDYELGVIRDRAEYDRIPDKDASYRPCRFFYDPQYANGVVYFDAAPAEAEDAYLVSWKPLVSIATLDTSVVLPEGYEEAIEYNLAMRLAAKFDRPVPKLVAALAVEGMKTIESFNVEIPLADLGLPVEYDSRYNVFTGEYF